MPLCHLVVTPLPNGRSGNTGFVSVHLAPRLREGGILQDYPDFRDWADFLATAPAMQFTVLINGVARPPAAVTITSPIPTATTWRALFGPPGSSPTPVQPFGFVDRVGANLTSVDSTGLAGALTPIVRAQVVKGEAPTTVADIEPLFAALQGSLTQARTFIAPTGNGADPVAPSWDFHQILHLLGAHPQIMRRLGLLFDLQVQLPAGAINEVQVTTNWATKTARRLRDEVPLRMPVDSAFQPVVADANYRSEGWLALGGAKYSVVQLDTPNAATQLGSLATELATAPDPTAPIDVPAVMESGISVVHRELAPVLSGRSQRARDIENGIDAYIVGPNAAAPTLTAEDVTLGHRIDAEDIAAPGFRSLHQRRAATGYSFPRNAAANFVPTDDEGWAQVAFVTDGTPVRPSQTSAVVYPRVEGGPGVGKGEFKDQTAWRVGDFLATWDGWSLAAARPGAVASPDGTVKPGNTSAPTSSQPAQMQINYAPVNDTLPRLRYGHTYRMRARTVDLAGAGPALGDTAVSNAVSPSVLFGRSLPVSPPVAVYRASRPDPGVGVSATTLVIRSELTQDDATVLPTDRLLFPPRTSQARVERHDLPAGGVDPASYAMLVSRDAVSLADQCLVDPETNDLVAGAAIVAGAVTPGPLKPDVNYLVDPMVRGVAFHDLPQGAPATSVVMPSGTWPTHQAVSLELRAGSGAPTSSATNRRVTARLPKGTTVDIRVSSAPVTAMLGHLAAYNTLTTGERTAMAASINAGRNLALTPSMRLRLVHAVRIPLTPPSFGPMTAGRTTVGQTTVVLDGSLLLHRATTDRASLRGRWVDQVDDPAAPAPSTATSRRHVGDVTITEAGDPAAALVSALSFDIGDPRRRSLELRMEAFCRYSRYFTERLDTTMPSTGVRVLATVGVSTGSVTVVNRTTGEVYARGTHFTVNGTAGSITRVSPTTIPNGTALRVEFIRLPVSRQSSEATAGQTVVVDVPASAAPAAPSVRAVVPAFARTVTQTANSITIVHDGRVLRALVERPWFTSGDGELLGVALDLAAVASPQLTRWGRDPIRAGAGPSARPTTATFTRARNSLANADGRFDVAGHTATFDAGRKLWTADIAVDATFGYRPWVRLNLCRYQPHAVVGAHVSDAVECEPVRLGALRTVTATSTALGQVSISVTGRDATNTMRVIVQTADAAISDPDLRWVDSSTVVLTRTGTTAAATFSGNVSLPAVATRRLVIEESEPTKVEVAGALANSAVVSFRETVDVPAGW